MAEIKIIRVTFKCGEEQFCIDRPYDNEKDDAQNCDIALHTLIDSMHSHTVVPALKVTAMGKGKPIFINLGMMLYIEIVHVGAYTVDDKTAKDENVKQGL